MVESGLKTVDCGQFWSETAPKWPQNWAISSPERLEMIFFLPVGYPEHVHIWPSFGKIAHFSHIPPPHM